MHSFVVLIYMRKDYEKLFRSLNTQNPPIGLFDRIILAIKQSNGEMKFNPTFRTVIDPGDTLIAVGETSKLKILEGMAKLT